MSELYQKFTFPNGLRLVTVPMKNTKAVTVLVLVGAGSKYETKEKNGISHFLEHMFFKGTKKRPNTVKLIEPLDRIGGEYNAFTGQEYTGYWAKVNAKYLDVALDWVSDIFLNSKLDAGEIEREKGVIIEEINMYLDEARRYVGDLWNKVLYGDQPAGWLISGEKENVLRFERKDFLEYLKSHYSAKNTVICLAGEISNVAKLKKKIIRIFSGINTQIPKSKQAVFINQKYPQALVYYKNTDQTHLCLGVRGYNLFHKNRYILKVLSAILGGGMSSRMWATIRERKALAYYVSVYSYEDLDSGFLVTQAGINNNKVEEAIKEILEQFSLLKNKKISLKELNKAKDFIIGSEILSMESSDAQASFYAFQELMKKDILTPDEIFAKIKAVNREEVLKVAEDIFQLPKLNLALIGPLEEKNKNKFLKILRKL